jgi:hypothetical protein
VNLTEVGNVCVRCETVAEDHSEDTTEVRLADRPMVLLSTCAENKINHDWAPWETRERKLELARGLAGHMAGPIVFIQNLPLVRLRAQVLHTVQEAGRGRTRDRDRGHQAPVRACRFRAIVRGGRPAY